MFNFKRFLLDTYDPERKREKRNSRKFSLQASSFKRKGDVSPQWQQRRSTHAGLVDELGDPENSDKPIPRRKKGIFAGATRVPLRNLILLYIHLEVQTNMLG